MKMNQINYSEYTGMRIEKIIDPNRDPVGAAAQTAQPWVSLNGGWIVTGTADVQEAAEFAGEFLRAHPKPASDYAEAAAAVLVPWAAAAYAAGVMGVTDDAGHAAIDAECVRVVRERLEERNWTAAM